jgi:hypothetical protein
MYCVTNRTLTCRACDNGCADVGGNGDVSFREWKGRLASEGAAVGWRPRVGKLRGLERLGAPRSSLSELVRWIAGQCVSVAAATWELTK